MLVSSISQYTIPCKQGKPIWGGQDPPVCGLYIPDIYLASDNVQFYFESPVLSKSDLAYKI
jgi:hypothetical protein